VAVACPPAFATVKFREPSAAADGTSTLKLTCSDDALTPETCNAGRRW
jgi:hypothetical protein